MAATRSAKRQGGWGRGGWSLEHCKNERVACKKSGSDIAFVQTTTENLLHLIIVVWRKGVSYHSGVRGSTGVGASVQIPDLFGVTFTKI